MKRSTSQRGYVLLIVLTVMTVLGGLVSGLAGYSAWYHRSTQTDRLRQVASAVRDSVVVCMEHAERAWEVHPDEPVDLDIRDLLPSGMEGTVTIKAERVSDADDVRYHVHIELARGRYARHETFELELPSTVASSHEPGM